MEPRNSNARTFRFLCIMLPSISTTCIRNSNYPYILSHISVVSSVRTKKLLDIPFNVRHAINSQLSRYFHFSFFIQLSLYAYWPTILKLGNAQSFSILCIRNNAEFESNLPDVLVVSRILHSIKRCSSFSTNHVEAVDTYAEY